MGQAGLLLAFVWVSTYLAARLGWRLGAASRVRATCYAALFCLPMVGISFWARSLPLWPEWMLHPVSVMLLDSWYPPFAACLIFIALRQAKLRQSLAQPGKQPNWRRLRLLHGTLAGMVLLASTLSILGRGSEQGWVEDVMTAQRTPAGRPIPLIDADGVVRQTTGYTCGACACANLLRKLDIASEATEEELVPLCLTRRWGGASTLGMAAALLGKAAFQGWHVRVLEPDWETFVRLRKPVLCTVKLNAFINHALVVLEIDAEKGVQVADPLMGLCWRPLEKFRADFLNEVVAVYREHPDEAGNVFPPSPPSQGGAN